MSVQYTGECVQYNRGSSVHRGDIMSTVWGYTEYTEGYTEYTEYTGYTGGTLSTLRGVQYNMVIFLF